MIDTHAHLLCLENMQDVINNMKKDGLDAIVNIGTTLEDSKQGVELAQKYENIYATVGIYPEYSAGVTDEDLKQIEELGKHKKVVAIGELGLIIMTSLTKNHKREFL